MLTAIRTGQRVTRLWNTAAYPQRLRDEAVDLQRRLTAMGGGRLRTVVAIGDLDGMYTNITHARMDAALDANIERLRNSVRDDRRYPLRCLDRISVGRRKTKQNWKTLGQRERDHGDSMRNLSLAFVDDKLVRVAYDHCIWSKASAEQYATDLMKYSHPLTMVPEPDADSTPFLETVTDNLMNDGSNLRTRHKLRPWRGASYRICRLGVAGTADMQVSTATATFMRIIDNSTTDATPSTRGEI